MCLCAKSRVECWRGTQDVIVSLETACLHTSSVYTSGSHSSVVSSLLEAGWTTSPTAAYGRSMAYFLHATLTSFYTLPAARLSVLFLCRYIWSYGLCFFGNEQLLQTNKPPFFLCLTLTCVLSWCPRHHRSLSKVSLFHSHMQLVFLSILTKH